MKLTHQFELASPGTNVPVLGIQVGVEYNTYRRIATPVSLAMYSYPAKQYVDYTLCMNDPFWSGIVHEALRVVDWHAIALRKAEAFNRIKDNVHHGITDREALGGLPEDYDDDPFVPAQRHESLDDMREQAERDYIHGR